MMAGIVVDLGFEIESKLDSHLLMTVSNLEKISPNFSISHNIKFFFRHFFQ